MAPQQQNEKLSPTEHLKPAATPLEMAVEGEKTVTMIFPKAATLTLDNHRRVNFPAGVQEVPVSLSTNIWLQRHGATLYQAEKVDATDTAQQEELPKAEKKKGK